MSQAKSATLSGGRPMALMYPANTLCFAFPLSHRRRRSERAGVREHSRPCQTGNTMRAARGETATRTPRPTTSPGYLSMPLIPSSRAVPPRFRLWGLGEGGGVEEKGALRPPPDIQTLHLGMLAPAASPGGPAHAARKRQTEAAGVNSGTRRN